MFEDALVESTGRTRSRKSWTTTISFTIQAAVLLAVILIARFSPQTVSMSRIDMRLPMPTIQARPVPAPTVKSPQMSTSTVTNEIATPASAAAFSTRLLRSEDGSPPATNFSGLTSSIGGGADKLDVANLAPTAPAAKVAAPVRLRTSSGTVQANCIACAPPLYPAVAQAVRESGTVVLQALISTNGTVEDLRVISGPVLLRQAAISAARTWRYKPTILSGRPVEVEAEISVIFHLD
jgi:protein TonB